MLTLVIILILFGLRQVVLGEIKVYQDPATKRTQAWCDMVVLQGIWTLEDDLLVRA